jgi:hypothetical protein
MANRVTDAEKQRVLELHKLGMSCTAIAKELGRSTWTVSHIAKEHGLEWASQQAAEATRVKVATNREKRATLESRFLDEAALLLDQLHQPHLVYNFGGRDNTYEEHTLAEPDVGAKRSLIQAASTAVDRAVRLAEVDKAASGAAEGAHLVGRLFAALGAVDDTQETPDHEAEGSED